MAKDYWIDCNKLQNELSKRGKSFPQASKEMGHNGTYLNHIRHRDGKTNESTILMLKHLYGIEFADIEQVPEQMKLDLSHAIADKKQTADAMDYSSNELYMVIKKAVFDGLQEWSSTGFEGGNANV